MTQVGHSVIGCGFAWVCDPLAMARAKAYGRARRPIGRGRVGARRNTTFCKAHFSPH